MKKYKIINRNLLKTKKGRGIIQKIVESLPIQLHIPSYNYCGPGTKLTEKNNPKPINRVDAICHDHDWAYKSAKNKHDIRRADCDMINKLNKLENLSTGEKIGRSISRAGIKAKIALGSGRKKTPPSRKKKRVK